MKNFGVKSATSAKWLLATSCLISVVQGSGANAMEFHRNGNKIYASGGFDLGDDIRLQRMLDTAADAGIVIDTVVFRTSPGGAAVAGTGMGKLIRDRGLNTAVQGGCYSACTAGFVGGVERHDAVDDLPSIHPDYERTVFGIHGSAGTVEDPNFYDVSVTTVSANQSDIRKHYRDLLGQEIPVEAMDRIDYAITHLTDSQGFLRYFVNDAAKTTTYCPGGNQAAADCIPYPGVTIRSDGLVTADRLDLSDDYLWIRNTVSGNINPNFRRFSIDSAAGEDPSIEQAYGVIRVADGGVWHMTEQTGADIIVAEKGGTIIVEPGTSAPAQLIAEDVKLSVSIFTVNVPTWSVASPRSVFIAASDGGTIQLRSGTLISDLTTTIRSGGTLSGEGTIASNLSTGAGSVFIPDAIRVQPFELLYQQDSANPSRVTVSGQDVRLTLGKDSDTIFNISADDTRSKIRLVEAETLVPKREAFFITFFSSYVPEVHHGRLVIAPGAIATLNVNRGFFNAGKRSTLVDVERIAGSAYGSPSTTDFAPGGGLGLVSFVSKTGQKPIIEGAFTTVRRDANDAGIAFSDGAIFRPRENSLLSFTLRQELESIYMVANRAFDDVALFGNHRTGNGLGEVLLKASDQDDPALAPLLGALQFANRDIARREAGSLRGDGHASLGLASANFVNLFGAALRTQIAGMRRLNAAHSDAGSHDAASADIPHDGNGTRFWVAGFGQTSRLARDGSIDRLGYDSLGTLFGISHRIGSNADVGAAFGYGRMDGRERQGSGIDGRVKGYGGSLYGDFSYGPGYVSAQAGYHRLKSRTDRSIIGIVGLEDLNRAKYSTNAITASFEHGISLSLGSTARLTAIVPALEYVRLSAIDFAETGPPAALVGKSRAYESVRAGAGLDLSETITTRAGQRFAPYARVMYKRELLDRGREYAFVNGFALDPGLRFDAVSRQLGRDMIEWGTGISSPANQAVTISLDYSAQAARGYRNHNIKIGFDVRF